MVKRHCGKRTYIWILAAAVATLPACESGARNEPSDASQDPIRDPAVSGAGITTIHMTDDMKFIPENPTISIGDTIVWVNDGSLSHTATDKPGSAAISENNVLPESAEPWDSGLLNKDDRFTLVLTVPGDYTYLCIFHEATGMIGKITVKE